MKKLRPLVIAARISTFIFFLLFCGMFALHAQWSSDPFINNQICGLAGDQAIPKIATCSNGDSYIGYFSSENGNYNVRLQRLDAAGNKLWATDGILISNNPQDTWLTDWDITCDNANHCILAFPDIRTGNTNVVAYRISPGGTFEWGANGILLSNTTELNASPKVMATSSGNAIIAWMAGDVIIMQKISPAGSLLWGPAGITLSSANRLSWPQLMSVGTDEFIMKYFDDAGSVMYPTRHVYAQRFNASGTGVWASPAAISLAGGISSWNQIFPFISDGSEGFYICWNDDRNNDTRANVFVQHVNSSGVAQYAVNGVEVSSDYSMNRFYPKMALPPGTSDVYVFWNEENNDQNQWGIYGQKVNSAGTSQWGATGKVFIPVSATDVYPYEARNSPTDVVLFYEEYPAYPSGFIKAMRISSTGTFVWTPQMKMMCSVGSQKVHPVINDFANNQWIASWEDDRNGNADIYAQNIQLNGDLGNPPAQGTISGTVTLNGGNGNVTMVVVQAGTSTTNPDSQGHYSMVVTAGTYTVTATLNWYATGSQPNVVVVADLTTTVNFTLNHLPSGTIEGTVNLTNGPGNIGYVVVRTGSQTTNPDGSGHYSLHVATGTYNVIATLPAYIPDTVYNLTVADGQIVSNVNLSLTLAPTHGLITGTVTLNGGTGVVTQVIVNGGGYTISPNSSGFYTLDVPAGYYDVSATLTGYIPQIILSVPVLVGQTTPNINFILNPSSGAGNILGHVTITGGTADVTLTDISAGTYSMHPSATGDYNLTVPAGNYSVTATHPYTTIESIPDVMVSPGTNTTGVNFILAINRADLVCSARNNYGGALNNVGVIIQGPEGPYAGTILTDSLTFPHVPFGTYNGTATYSQGSPVLSDTIINAANHHLVFIFTLTGIARGSSKSALEVVPNPAGPESMILFSIPADGVFSFELLDTQGSRAGELKPQYFASGNHQFTLSSIHVNKRMVPGFYLLKLTGVDEFVRTCKIIYRGQ